MFENRNVPRFSLGKSIVKLLGIALGFTVLMGSWRAMEVRQGTLPTAHAAQADSPMQDAQDAKGRFMIPLGATIQSRLLDGRIGPEWNDANLLTGMPFHDADDESITFATRIWVKHDGQFLYFACEIEQSRVWNDFWFFIMLDADGDRSVLSDRDDYLQVPAAGRAVPRPTDLHFDAARELFIPDVNKGGTNDIEGGGREDRSGRNRLYRIEGKHPFNTGDPFDTAWRARDTVGLLFGFVGLGRQGAAKMGDETQQIGKNGNPDDLERDFAAGDTKNNNPQVAASGDVDGDGDDETIVDDPNRRAEDSSSSDEDGDGDKDVIVLGTQGLGKVGAADVDGDGDGDDDLIAEDPNILPENSGRRDLDGDGDDDFIVGTKGRRKVAAPANVDDDKDDEIILEDATLLPENSFGRDLDGDGDQDLIVVGTQGQSKMAESGDVDGDGDEEIIVQDPTLLPETPRRKDLDGDGDIDLVVVGTRGLGKVVAVVNMDGISDDDAEIIVADPTLSPMTRSSFSLDLDGDGDQDVIVAGTRGLGKLAASGDVDGDGDQDLAAEDPTISPQESSGKEGSDVDGDGDTDITRVGTKVGEGRGRIIEFTSGERNIDLDDDGDDEIIMEDPTLPFDSSYGEDLDGDGDIDLVVVGVQGGRSVIPIPHLSPTGGLKVRVDDPTIRREDSSGLGVDVDRDGDADILVFGSKSC